MGLTRDICEVMHAISYDSLGERCVAGVKQAIADGVAVAIAGCKEPQLKIGVEHMLSLGGTPQATVWGWGVKASVVQAAYLNAAATHVLDFEPMASPPGHCVSPTVPVAFALAETHEVTGKQLIAAVAKGIELQGRMQYAGNLFIASKLRFHPPGTVGVLGAAMVGTDLLGLGVEGMQHALGLAASRAGALLANIGSMTKCTHNGNAAGSGLDAALLVKRGLNANPDVLEAPKGVIATYYPDGFDPERLLAFGKPFRIVDPGMAIKMFPSQISTQFAIAAALELAPQIPDKSAITRLRIVAPALRHIDRPKPKSGLEGKHSLQYTAGIAVLDGTVKIASFSNERRFRDDIVRLLEKTEVVLDESISEASHEMHMTVEAELNNGRRLSATCRGPKGTWGVPLTASEHRGKLADCLSTALSSQQTGEVIDRLEQLESQDSAGIRKIVSLLSASA